MLGQELQLLRQAGVSPGELAAPAEAEILGQQGSLQQALASLRSAEARLAQLLDGSPRRPRFAPPRLRQRRRGRTMDRLLEGSTHEVRAAEARVTQARTAVEQARVSVDQSAIVAPFAGVVLAVNVRPGEAVGSSTGITVGDLSRLRLETQDLDEFGAARIRVGDVTNVSFSAFEGRAATARVVTIAPQGVTESGDANFRVVLEFEAVEPDLRPGMTARVEFP